MLSELKSLGVTLQQGLSFDLRVTGLLKQCSQCIYLLQLFHSQGLSSDQLNVVCWPDYILSIVCFTHLGVLVSAGQAGRINAF